MITIKITFENNICLEVEVNKVEEAIKIINLVEEMKSSPSIPYTYVPYNPYNPYNPYYPYYTTCDSGTSFTVTSASKTISTPLSGSIASSTANSSEIDEKKFYKPNKVYPQPTTDKTDKIPPSSLREFFDLW